MTGLAKTEASRWPLMMFSTGAAVREKFLVVKMELEIVKLYAPEASCETAPPRALRVRGKVRGEG